MLRSSFRTLGLSIVPLTALCWSAGASADDEEQRAAAAIAKQTPVVSNAPIQWRGYSVRLNQYVETEGGVDTNPDNSFDEDGTGFVKAEAGLRATLENAKEYYALALKGRYLDFRDIEDNENREDFKAALDTRYTLSDTETLSAGTYFLRDLISVAKADIFHSYAEYALRTDTYRLKLTAKNHTEHNFDNDVQGTQTADEFFVTRAKAFDYSRSDGQLSVLAFPKNFVQPYVIADFGNIDYYSQFSGASLDRDAIEQFGIAGLRFQFDRDFRVDVGYRLNHREFEDPTISDRTTNFVDVNIFWQPYKDLRITGIVERYFDEATSSFGLVDDVRSYGVTFDWDMAAKWRLAGTTYYDQERPVGDDVNYDKITSTLSLTHYYDEHIELFLSGLAKWVDEQTTGDDYERYKIGSGIRVKF